ncbi:hypothetical protein [Nocardia fluminea]|uniref:hypothetical protein n=1 Tax=Nocardia fluminea TaxID=134984 RepID=UPI00379994FC
MAAIRKIWIGAVAGVTVVLAGCGSGDPQPPGSSSVRPATTITAPVSIATPSVAPAVTPAGRPGGGSPGGPAPSVGASTAPAKTARPPEPAPACAESAIETELGVDAGPVATIADCDGQWGVIRWDTPGDNQRLITRTSGTWTTYVGFPHDICWSIAVTDGVPERLRTYFNC